MKLFGFLLIAGWIAFSTPALAQDFIPTSSYTAHTIEGWTVRLSPDFDEENRARLLAIIARQLKDIGAAVPATALDKIRQTTFWVELVAEDNEGGRYFPNISWVEEQGLNPDKAFGIELTSDGLEEAETNPSLLLHELAHAYHEQVLALDAGPITLAYEAAMANGRYDSVDEVSGGLSRAYALFDEHEFFAELTEAYYGRNDFFPFDRAELEAFDPQSAKAIRDAWNR